MAVHYPPTVALSMGTFDRARPGTGGTVVFDGTNTMAPISEDMAGAVPIIGSRLVITVEAGVIPEFWLQDTDTEFRLEFLADNGVRISLVTADVAATAAEEARAAVVGARIESGQVVGDTIALATAGGQTITVGGSLRGPAGQTGGVGPVGPYGGTAVTDPQVRALVIDRDSATGQAVRAVTRRMQPVALGSSRAGTSREYPTLVRPTTTPLLTKTATGQTLNSLYWPRFVDRWQGNPGVDADERYALVFSTDHAVEPAPRIGWATAPYPLGPWTARGMLYKDTTAGSQTETPTILWDEDTQVWLMYYQQKGVGLGDQSTLLATSPDFTTWTRVGIVGEQDPAKPGVGHMGYRSVFPWAGEYYGWSLAGQGYMTMWYSPDGYVWEQDARISPPRPDLLRHLPGFDEAAQWMIRWTNAQVLSWNGRPWIISVAGPYAPGGDVVQDALITAPLTDDLRDVAARPVNLSLPLAAGETMTQGMGGFITADDGRVFGVQRANGPSGHFIALEVI